MRNYKNIKVFQLADKLVLEVYKITRSFPKEENYGLTSQIRRAAVSVPANIAEGSSRKHKNDYLYFLYISRGSLCELEYLLQLANKLEYFGIKEFEKINNLISEVSKTLFGLIDFIEKDVKSL